MFSEPKKRPWELWAMLMLLLWRWRLWWTVSRPRGWEGVHVHWSGVPCAIREAEHTIARNVSEMGTSITRECGCRRGKREGIEAYVLLHCLFSLFLWPHLLLAFYPFFVAFLCFPCRGRWVRGGVVVGTWVVCGCGGFITLIKGSSKEVRKFCRHLYYRHHSDLLLCFGNCLFLC